MLLSVEGLRRWNLSKAGISVSSDETSCIYLGGTAAALSGLFSQNRFMNNSVSNSSSAISWDGKLLVKTISSSPAPPRKISSNACRFDLFSSLSGANDSSSLGAKYIELLPSSIVAALCGKRLFMTCAAIKSNVWLSLRISLASYMLSLSSNGLVPECW